MDKEKQIVEDVDVEWTSSDSSDSSSDDELVETLRRSRFESEFLQHRHGAESSNVRQERDTSDYFGSRYFVYTSDRSSDKGTTKIEC